MKTFLKDLWLMAQLRLRHWKYVWGENGRLIGIGSLVLKIEIGCETGRRKYRKVKKSSREDRKIEDEAFLEDRKGV